MEQLEILEKKNVSSAPRNTGVATVPGPSRRQASTEASFRDRITELEMENSRLQQLVAELLIKNHQLRKP